MKTCLGIAFYAAIFCLAPIVSAADLADVIDGLRPSVVGVGTHRPARGSQKPAIDFRGTGFVVGNGRQVITNYHVLPERLDRQQKESLAIFVGRGKNAKVMAVNIVGQDRDHDLALLEIINGSLPAMRLGEAAFIREGSDIAITGFPIGIVLGL